MSNEATLKTINTVLKDKLSEINGKLPGYIKAANLAPLAQVTSGSWDVGSITIGDPPLGETVGVTISYDITNLTGLQNSQFGSLTVQTESGPMSSFTAQGEFTVNTDNKPLAVDWNGKGTASAGHLGSIDQPLNGTGSADCTASGTMTVKGGLSNSILTIDSIVIDTLALSSSGYGFTVDGLGPLNQFLQPIESYLGDALSSYIDAELDGRVKNALNNGLASAVPITVPLN